MALNTASARERLEVMLGELDRSIAILNGEHPETDHHVADAGANLFDADRIEAGLDAMKRQRAAVIAAVARTEAGTYGRCADCGKPVPEGRLEARPEAARCVNCQARAEGRRHSLKQFS